jgi:hypothetical protein
MAPAMVVDGETCGHVKPSEIAGHLAAIKAKPCALDLGRNEEGAAVQLLPSGVTYANVLAPDIAHRRGVGGEGHDGR